MANICENIFYAESTNSENLKTIEEWFNKNWNNIDMSTGSNFVNVYFDSKWTFPKDDMDKLFNIIPDKSNIFMRCLSVEYGNLYHALWICDNKNGWHEV